MNAYVAAALVWLVLTVLMVIAMDQLTRRRHNSEQAALREWIATGRLSLPERKDGR